MARPSIDHQHRDLHGLGAKPVQGLLAELMQASCHRPPHGRGEWLRARLLKRFVCNRIGRATDQMFQMTPNEQVTVLPSHVPPMPLAGAEL
jgi:hypothetical protein